MCKTVAQNMVCATICVETIGIRWVGKWANLLEQPISLRQMVRLAVSMTG